MGAAGGGASRRVVACDTLAGGRKRSSPAAAGRRPALAIALAGALLLAAGPPAAAQESPLSRVPPGSPIPRILPPAPPPVGGALPLPPPAAPSVVPPVSVAVNSVVVEGATAFLPSRLASFTAGLVGPAVPLSKIEAARVGILNLYRASGYVLTTVSAAVDARGRLRFVVTEGYVRDVKLEGDIGPAGTQVLRFLRHLTEERPINAATLERWLLLAQDVPGVSVQAVLRPNPDDPGALTLVARVSRAVLSGLFTADNRAFRLSGPQEGLAIVDLNSFTEFGERTEFSLYRTAGGTQTFGQAAEEFFVGGSGLRIRLYGGAGDATPSGFLHAIGFEGQTTTFGAAAIYPLIRSRQQTLNLSGYLDAVEDEVWTNSGPEGARLRASRDSVRVFRVGANYALQDLLAGADRSAINAVAVRVSQGLSGFGGTGNDNPNPSRPGERIDFTKLDAQLSRTQTLFQPWKDASVALEVLTGGQITNKELPAVEKFFLGGSQFTRGFYSGEVTGDQALYWTLELQLNTGLDLVVFHRPVNIAAQFYTFYDRGEAWQLLSSERNVRLSSEGIGVRLNITRYTELDLEGDIRNTRLPEGTSATVKPEKAEAFYWRVVARF
jgi:hemolysin activation/secretion protein